MSVLSIGKLRSRRYIRVELKKSIMGWEFEKGYVQSYEILDSSENTFLRSTVFLSSYLWNVGIPSDNLCTS